MVNMLLISIKQNPSIIVLLPTRQNKIYIFRLRYTVKHLLAFVCLDHFVYMPHTNPVQSIIHSYLQGTSFFLFFLHVPCQDRAIKLMHNSVLFGKYFNIVHEPPISSGIPVGSSQTWVDFFSYLSKHVFTASFGGDLFLFGVASSYLFRVREGRIGGVGMCVLKRL